ncbi:hypothetical protein ACFCV8_00935 [Streptomyces sp. NPDC056347]|uniref:hypothetical protein n=1 Tax=Streptomyces sp. NPDC056347 TaxID=3345790 RepID=UPI0035D6CB14
MTATTTVTLAAGVGEMTSYTLTSAGLALGIALLAVEHVTWWRGGGGKKSGGPGAATAEGGGKAKDPMELIPGWFGIAFGTLMVACPAGLLGYASGFLRWGGNGIGGAIMSWMTGADAQTIANSSAPRIDQGGALVVTALVVTLWLLRKKFPKATRGKFKKGVFIGVLLAIGTGVFAMIGNLVVPGANDLGNWALDAVLHADFGVLV